MRRILFAGAIFGQLFATVQTMPVTYYRDVLPILQKHCLMCHRPDQVAPISLVSYGQARPWADAIKHVVVTARMPPWSRGGPVSVGEDHILSMSEVETIVQWVDGGALAGDAKDAPPPVFPEEAPRRHKPTSTTP